MRKCSNSRCSNTFDVVSPTHFFCSRGCQKKAWQYKKYHSDISCKEKRLEQARLWREDRKNAAKLAWYGITSRLKEARPCYVGIENRLVWESFKAWFEANWFENCSVDRMDAAGHYELNNLQMLTVAENRVYTRRNKNIWAPKGSRWCVGCKVYLQLPFFYKNKAQPSGYDSYCKKCKVRQVNEYKKKKRGRK
jgi:hypothetical protein